MPIKNPPVLIQLGEILTIPLITEITSTKTFSDWSFICNPRDFYMEVKDIGRFLIKEGYQVIIEIDANGSIEKALPFFYGTVLTVLLHMHHSFPIHASGVLSKSGINLFCAKSGTGKSTLAFNLFKRGFPLFTDDKCVIRWDSILKRYLAEPSIRAVRLWQDAIDQIGHSKLEKGIPVIQKMDKFQFNLDTEMYEKAQFMHKIFVIRKIPDIAETTIQKLNFEQRKKAIRNNIHRPQMIVGEKMVKRHRLFIENVSKRISVYLVRRPSDIPIETFVDFMEKQIKK